MPAPLMQKNEVLDRLLATLRDRGYDGASLAELAAAAGLGTSRLARLFPGGKEDIARQVLQHLEERLERAAFAPLRSKQAPARKLAALLAAIDDVYDGGRSASLLERMSASAGRLAFRGALGHAYGVWLDALEALCIEAGLPKRIARDRAEDFVLRIEGALVVASATGDPTFFARTLEAMRTSLLGPRAEG